MKYKDEEKVRMACQTAESKRRSENSTSASKELHQHLVTCFSLRLEPESLKSQGSHIDDSSSTHDRTLTKKQADSNTSTRIISAPLAQNCLEPQLILH
jgi:hypothetical protein